MSDWGVSQMHPAHLYLDSTLEPIDTVKSALSSTDLCVFDSNEHLDRLHRLLYPVFRVEYEYETSDGLLRSGTETGVFLVDGLWDENDDVLSQYAAGSEVTRQVPFDRYDLGTDHDRFGRTILLEFQSPDGAAADVLPNRLDGLGNRHDPEGYLADLREEFGLPEAFDADSFERIVDISRVYLPFWLAQVRSERTGDVALVSFRDRTDLGQRSTPHDWLADYIAADPTRLPAYGYNVRHTADGGGSEETDTTAAETADDAGTDDAATENTTSQPSGTQPVETEDTVTQPEAADLDAESLVEPNPGRGFADVGGMAALKETFEKTVIAPVEQPDRYAAYGLDPVSGVLLYGPPGCGKTYTAGALAGELGYYFIEVTPADLTSQYMGKPAQNVSDLFEIARANQPCVVFIDELDAMAAERTDDMNTSEQQAVNQLLTELEAIEDEDIVVLGATNRVEDIDPAIRRSGRFDERVEVPPPDSDARRAILELHLTERPTADGLTYERAVERTVGHAASDLERIADVTARKALEDGADIGTDHLLSAVEAVDSSIDGWTGEYRIGGRSVTQPDDVELNATSLVTAEPARSFDDVGGMADLTETLSRRVIEPLDNPETFAEYGIDVLSGLLLYGPPGCGKTYVTEALAGELGHYFVKVTPADLTSKWMGQPAQNVADLFTVARANQPCILFIDELDALAGERSGDMNTSERQLVNQLLTELETLDDDDVVVVGATNLVEDIDAAIRRSGRFDERIEVPPPDADARRAILSVHLTETPTSDDIDWATVAAETAGYVASDLELLAENAARRALRRDGLVKTEDLLGAVSETHSSLDSWEDQHRYEQSETTSELTRSR